MTRAPRVSPLVAAASLLAGAPLAAVLLAGRRPLPLDGRFHFQVVTASALVTAFAATAVSLAGARRRDPRAVIVGLAFSVMAAILAVHGLATPPILTSSTSLVAFSAGATLPAGGALLSLSALPPLRRPGRIPLLLGLQGALIGLVLALGVVGFAAPSVIPAAPQPGGLAALATLVAGAPFFLLLGLRAARTFALTRRPADLVVVVGLAWLATSLFAGMTLRWGVLGFWLGHALELCGSAAVCAPVVADLQRAAQSRPLAGDLDPGELVLAEEAFLGGHVRALMLRLAEKDAYTERHTRAVALHAVRVGRELGLPPGRLRSLALGGLLHDMGKLRVPAAVLQKPAALDEEERAVIRRHPEWGVELLDRLGGFGEAARRLVLDHHERLDGKGYPRGLRADQIDLDTRILTVCDVYDALVSTRVYRTAWTHERALQLLRDETGTAFDGRCVEALARVLERELPGELPRAA